MVYLPADRILFPSIGGGYPSEWVAALRKAEATQRPPRPRVHQLHPGRRRGRAALQLHALREPHDAAMPGMDPELLADPSVYPDSTVMGLLEFLHDLGEARAAYDRIWTRLRAGRKRREDGGRTPAHAR